jgi:hypothetical protein
MSPVKDDRDNGTQHQRGNIVHTGTGSATSVNISRWHVIDMFVCSCLILQTAWVYASVSCANSQERSYPY